MQTGFDIMEYDSALRNLWARRIAAGFVDFVITLAIAYALGYFFKWNMGTVIFIWQGIIWFIYSVIFDAINGKTPGKYIFKLKAVSFIGSLDIWKAIGRNATKLNWIIYIADIIAGLSTEGEPRQRYSERILDCLVISDFRFREERKTKTFRVEEEKEEFELPE
ncbi:hypothetical protein AciM339_1383 [Aciduliprofundum sp. MAR08-339]|nr:hypothetical protein AciM339_1383 [Aciduliprofundum sp. MAR08-339]